MKHRYTLLMEPAFDGRAVSTAPNVGRRIAKRSKRLPELGISPFHAYVLAWAGLLFLAAVLDALSRRIAGSILTR
jgi:hypothetical protein